MELMKKRRLYRWSKKTYLSLLCSQKPTDSRSVDRVLGPTSMVPSRKNRGAALAKMGMGQNLSYYHVVGCFGGINQS